MVCGFALSRTLTASSTAPASMQGMVCALVLTLAMLMASATAPASTLVPLTLRGTLVVCALGLVPLMLIGTLTPLLGLIVATTLVPLALLTSPALGLDILTRERDDVSLTGGTLVPWLISETSQPVSSQQLHTSSCSELRLPNSFGSEESAESLR